MLHSLILFLHVLISVGLITLVLIQQGKGAEAGAGLGSGASQTVFGSHGSSSFLFKLTGLFALLFFITSLSLGYLAGHGTMRDSVESLAELARRSPPAPANPLAGYPVKQITPSAQIPIPEGTG